jgi:hypothetical protein
VTLTVWLEAVSRDLRERAAVLDRCDFYARALRVPERSRTRNGSTSPLCLHVL